MKTLCPVCDGEIKVPVDAIVGEIITCPDCGSSYEIKSINNDKVLIKPADVEGEDWGE